ncbi:hypothetical protein GTL58_004398 [Salmonella enterica]|nr:hypothetical protein [Salmonella enterica]
MYDFAQWVFVDKQRKQKFEDISAGHEAFMRAIGQITEAPKKEDKGPECPSVFLDVFDKYRTLKFAQRVTDEAVKLYAREMLSWQDIIAFKAATGHNLSLLESELIMGIDAIFEGRDDG